MRQQNSPKGSPEPTSGSEITVRMERPRRDEAAPRCPTCGHAPLLPDGSCPVCAAERAVERAAVAVGADPVSAPARPAEPLIVDGRYRVESELGRGGMGIVYLAEDTWLHRPVALKMIEPSWAAASPDAVKSFLREARALASIRNEYVVQVYAFGLHEGAHFFAMEYVRGRTLRQILTTHQEHGDTIPVNVTLTILRRVAQGIDAVHAAGIVHRDVKPTNVVIEEHTGRPVLLDFGLAVHSQLSSGGHVSGTPQYMAPEQMVAPAGMITSRADVYALGVTAYEMLSGKLPFQSTDLPQLVRLHTRKKPPNLSSIRKDLVVFDKVVARALAKDPDERYPTCTAFGEVLAVVGERWIASTLPTLPPPPPELIGAAAEWVVNSLPVPPPAPSRPSTEEPRPAERPAPASQEAPEGPPRRVLVVDDSPVFRKFTVQAAQMAFYRSRKGQQIVVEGASSGQEAIERATAQPPDLVLLDFDMPGLDGVDTLSRLRALPGGDRARAVVVSGRVGPADRWRFSVLGVNDFVMKPIDFRQLVERLEGIVRRLTQREHDA